MLNEESDASRRDLPVYQEPQAEYFQVIGLTIRGASTRARVAAAAAQELVERAVTGLTGPELMAVLRLQREAANALQIALFFARLYVAALKWRGADGIS